MKLLDLATRLRRIGIDEAAQIVERYEKVATELHVAGQKIIGLTRDVARLERRAKAERDADVAAIVAMLRAKVQGRASEHDAGVRYAAHLVEEWNARRT